jgi:hypothetical protein
MVSDCWRTAKVIGRRSKASSVDVARAELHTKAWALYEKQSFGKAAELLESVLRLPQPLYRDHDAAALLLLNRVHRIILEGTELPDSWSGFDPFLGCCPSI